MGRQPAEGLLAIWLLRDCGILIFDETTRGIDIGAKSEIYNLYGDQARPGKTIILIPSELPKGPRLPHRIAVTCEGRLSGILTGGPDITQEDIMELATRRETAMRTEEKLA